MFCLGDASYLWGTAGSQAMSAHAHAPLQTVTSLSELLSPNHPVCPMQQDAAETYPSRLPDGELGHDHEWYDSAALLQTLLGWYLMLCCCGFLVYASLLCGA